jgi:cytosine/adenosine deaminase-related metal-dependent hydrolase
MSTWIRNGLVVTLDSEDHIYEGYDLLLIDGKITEIGQDLAAAAANADKVIDATDKLVMPGLLNAHLHSYDGFMKGLWEDLPLEVWFPYANLGARRQLTQREIYVRTQLVATEMLRTGTTSAYDVCTLLPLDHESIDTLMSAYRDAGIRAFVCAQVVNKPRTETMPYLDEIMPPDVLEIANGDPPPPDAELLDKLRWMIDKWHGVDGHLHVALAPSAPQRCTDEFLLSLDDLSKEKSLPMNLHIQETRVQAVTGPVLYGKSIVEYVHTLGLLSPRLSIIHGVWLSGRDIELIAAGGTSVVHNPISNLRLKSGIAPVRELLQAGVNVALGNDNNCANDAQNLFQAMKFAALLPEVAGPGFGGWEPAREALRMATAGGAKAVLMQDAIGSLEVGKRADIVLLDLNTQAFTPLNDPVHQLVYCETGHSVDTVLVNGNVVLEGGAFVNLDEEALLQEAKEIGESLLEENEKAAQWASKLRPYLEQMYWRCLEQDVAVNRYTRPHPAR